MNYDTEQQTIINHIESLCAEHNGYGWGHFQGDVIPRILAHYISLHLPNNRKIVGPNVYIEGLPTEYDLLVVDVESNPIPFTSAYPREHIRCVIEVKRIGVIGTLITFPEGVGKIKSNFDKALGHIKERNSNCKAAYITVSETVKPNRVMN